VYDYINLNEKNIKEFRSLYTGKDFELSVYDIFLHYMKYPTVYPIIKRKVGLKLEDIETLQKYTYTLDQRLRTLFNYAEHRDCSIMIDAEQTYLQTFIDYVVAYYFKIFNQDKCLLWNTLQCYLKKEPQSLQKWRRFCDQNSLTFGLKLVRGAYLTEERNIATEQGLLSPVCDNLSDTDKNYNESVKFLFETYKQGDKVTYSLI
jgi:proline dehydrogenase